MVLGDTNDKGIVIQYPNRLMAYGCANISNDWKTAVEQSIELQRAYIKGLNDGYQKAVEEAREFYQGKEKENGKEEN